MPRTLKSSPFFLYAAKKSGYWKNKMLLGINHGYEGGSENISVTDLVDFLKKNNIDPSEVKLENNFMVRIVVKPAPK